MFRNKTFDSGGGSITSRNSYDRGRGDGRSGQRDDSRHNQFSDDLVLKVNSGDIGRIIGMLINQYIVLIQLV